MTMATRIHWPVRLRLTVRTKLAAIYGALILATGAMLLTVVYLSLKHNVDAKARAIRLETAKTGVASAAAKVPGGPAGAPVDKVVSQSASDTLHHLVVVSAFSLAAFTVVALFIGWWLAGRMLAPVHRITATARDLSWRDLGQRIALTGPRDELKELGDTFDSMLARLNEAFESQRRFIANVSHELRTPLGVQRVAIQLGLTDPSPDEVVRVRGHLLDANRRMERLIDGLLLLAQCDRGLPHREPVALHEIAGEAIREHAARAAEARVDIVADLRPVVVDGDALLLKQLLANLVGNGLRYNSTPGRLAVTTRDEQLVVANTGPHIIPDDQVERLFEPFTRFRPPAAATGSAGLGLSIVRAIVRAHGGTVTAQARAGGGLAVCVSLPREPDGSAAGAGRPAPELIAGQ
jgi:signal transduction histidine kinase